MSDALRDAVVKLVAALVPGNLGGAPTASANPWLPEYGQGYSVTIEVEVDESTAQRIIAMARSL